MEEEKEKKCKCMENSTYKLIKGICELNQKYGIGWWR